MARRQGQDGGPIYKRSKPSEDNVVRDDEIYAKNIQRAWEHYRNFIDGEDSSTEVYDVTAGDERVEFDTGAGGSGDEDGEGMHGRFSDGDVKGGGDVDELLELIEILSKNKVSPLAIDPSADDGCEDDDYDANQRMLFRSIESLLPILMSMSYLHLASHAISETMFDPNQQKGNNEEDSSPEYYFQQSLLFWPTNPAAHSLLANYNRMNSLASTEEICEHYVNAAEYANCWRKLALFFFQSDYENEQGVINAKEWTELLVLNGSLDVDYIGGGDDSEGDEDANTEQENEEEEYSCSEVEATASFMSAFLLSTLSKHEIALQYLKKFRLSHRLHPNVWEAQKYYHQDNGKDTSFGDRPTPESSVLFPPRIYGSTDSSNRRDKSNGVLPPELYQRLCTLFAPKATYWDESDYNNRGYYSYFIDLDARTDSSLSVRECPANVMEDVIVNQLLPLAERTLKENSKSSSPSHIVGAEWWVHTRPLGANLGHQIHFDTDESLLGKEKQATHPIISSVLYLTGGDKGATAGPTVVFDQTPTSKDVASKAWISYPQNNAFMNFAGNLLHGVLPCGAGSKEKGNGSMHNEDIHRLTFMVGFWTRNITEGLGDRELYSPSGPLPPATSEHSWVIASQQGYCDKREKNKNGGNAARREHQSNLMFDILPSVSPAWEQFDRKANPQMKKSRSELTIPKGLDHRFFVWNAPHCFSESLFEKDDCF